MRATRPALFSGFWPRSRSRYDGSQNRKNHQTGSVSILPSRKGQISR